MLTFCSNSEDHPLRWWVGWEWVFKCCSIHSSRLTKKSHKLKIRNFFFPNFSWPFFHCLSRPRVLASQSTNIGQDLNFIHNFFWVSRIPRKLRIIDRKQGPMLKNFVISYYGHFYPYFRQIEFGKQHVNNEKRSVKNTKKRRKCRVKYVWKNTKFL